MTNRKPLPKEIYQRRRMAALVVLLVAVFGFVAMALAFSGGGEEQAASGQRGSEQPPADAAGASASQTMDPAEESEGAATAASTAPGEGSDKSKESEKSAESEGKDPKDSKDPKESEAKDPSKKVAADAKKTCDLQDLEVVAATKESTVEEGQLPTFYMTVNNPTAADCKIDLDKNILRFEVYRMSDNQRIWSDTDCYAPVETGEQEFESGKDRSFEAVWSRKGAAPGQCTDRPVAEPGSYYLHAVVGDNPSEPVAFNLK